MYFKDKNLKYKNKYLNLKHILGGMDTGSADVHLPDPVFLLDMVSFPISDDPKNFDFYEKANSLIQDFLKTPFTPYKPMVFYKEDEPNGIGESDFTGFNEYINPPFNEITFKGYKIKFIEFIGKGLYKTGLKVYNLTTQTYMAFIIWSSKVNSKAAETIVMKQRIAEKLGYAVHVYAFEDIENDDVKKHFILMDLVQGENICIQILTEKIQLKIIKAFLDLGNIHLIQADQNCGNIFYDVQTDKITIIDDFSIINGETKLEYLNEICSLVSNIQHLREYELITIFLIKFILNNKVIFKIDSIDEKSLKRKLEKATVNIT